MQKIYDVIIVGAGMAGLYTAFLLKSQNPKISLLVIEKNNKQHLGGRANTELFYGTKISIGAGIGRTKKDKLLAELMRHFKMPVKHYMVEHHIATIRTIDVPETMRLLKKEYEKHKTHMRENPQTFRQFAKHVLGETDYNRFLNSTGFTDYEHEDAYETIYEYGMEDNLGGWKAFSVAWHDLVQHLYNSVGTSNFIFGKKVTGIQQYDTEINVKTVSNLSNHPQIFAGKKVVIATTVDTLRQVFPKNAIYKDIEPQPFMRVYGKFDKASVSILKEVLPRFTYVDFPIQKIIPIDPDNGVYMIVYNDNASSLALKNRIENTAQNRQFYENLLENLLKLPRDSLHLIGIRTFYWNYGTHYYKPLSKSYKTREEFIRKAQRPYDNIFVVGELVSRNQGWTEGALESVKEIISEM
uniref:Amine oxidase domain-containing protein n=1 Tax=viral metagenome TaxID=1070528 RepID=A0A6C0HXV5_9ZZZZ